MILFIFMNDSRLIKHTICTIIHIKVLSKGLTSQCFLVSKYVYHCKETGSAELKKSNINSADFEHLYSCSQARLVSPSFPVLQYYNLHTCNKTDINFMHEINVVRSWTPYGCTAAHSDTSTLMHLAGDQYAPYIKVTS
jgi:hypothetical protein